MFHAFRFNACAGGSDFAEFQYVVRRIGNLKLLHDFHVCGKRRNVFVFGIYKDLAENSQDKWHLHKKELLANTHIVQKTVIWGLNDYLCQKSRLNSTFLALVLVLPPGEVYSQI